MPKLSEALADSRGRKDTLWRRSATADELAMVERIDRRLRHIEIERAELTRSRYIVTNRCCQRERARAKAKEAGHG